MLFHIHSLLREGGKREEICHASSLHWRKHKKCSKREILAALMRHIEETLIFYINLIIQVTLPVFSPFEFSDVECFKYG